MCRPPFPFSKVTYPQFNTVTGRTLGCWMKSWWYIGNEFAETKLHPGTVLGVLAPVIHGYIQAEFPLFYQKAFYAWKWNMGYRTIVDDGYSLTALYPLTAAWIDHFIATRYYWQRDATAQPNSCVCCAGKTSCWTETQEIPGFP